MSLGEKKVKLINYTQKRNKSNKGAGWINDGVSRDGENIISEGGGISDRHIGTL